MVRPAARGARSAAALRLRVRERLRALCTAPVICISFFSRQSFIVNTSCRHRAETTPRAGPCRLASTRCAASAHAITTPNPAPRPEAM